MSSKQKLDYSFLYLLGFDQVPFLYITIFFCFTKVLLVGFLHIIKLHVATKKSFLHVQVRMVISYEYTIVVNE